MAEWGDWYPFVGGGKFRQNLRDPNRIQYQPLLPMDFIEVSIKVDISKSKNGIFSVVKNCFIHPILKFTCEISSKYTSNNYS